MPVMANMSAPDANAPSTTPSSGMWSTTALAPAILSAASAASRVSLAATVSRSAGNRRPTATSMPLQQSIRCGRKRPRSVSSAMRSTTYSSTPPAGGACAGPLGAVDVAVDDQHEDRQPQRGELLEPQRAAVGRAGDADDGARVGGVDVALQVERLERGGGLERDRVAVLAGQQHGAQLAEQPGVAAHEELERAASAGVHRAGVERPTQALEDRGGGRGVHISLLPRPAERGYVRPRASLSGSSV